MTLILTVKSAAFVIARLVREGVRFEAEQNGETVVVRFTGGF